jgi:hypothetical protein
VCLSFPATLTLMLMVMMMGHTNDDYRRACERVMAVDCSSRLDRKTCKRCLTLWLHDMPPW